MFFYSFLNSVLVVTAILIAVPIVVFAIECFSAAFLSRSSVNSSDIKTNPDTAILIPAHNEAKHIGMVVQEALKQLKPNDRLVVIADNCHDDTAEIARAAGAKVIERVNEIDKGKGYALDCGLQYLKDVGAPEVVVFLDADCVMSKGTITEIASLAYSTGRPVQAKYLMEQEGKPTLKDRVSTFALKVKNHVRFLGLNRLDSHCLLTGSGMAFPWSAINRVSLVGAINADDMKLTVDLTLENIVPLYCENSLVMGRLMEDGDAQSQRTRWEHGHLQMISAEVPRLIKAWIRQPRLAFLVLALDISIPPLSLLVTLWLGTTLTSFILTTLLGLSWLSLSIFGVSGLILLTAVLTAWSKFGTEDLPFKDLVAIPFYIVGKLPIYFKFLVNPQTGWLTTERD